MMTRNVFLLSSSSGLHTNDFYALVLLINSSKRWVIDFNMSETMPCIYCIRRKAFLCKNKLMNPNPVKRIRLTGITPNRNIRIASSTMHYFVCVHIYVCVPQIRERQTGLKDHDGWIFISGCTIPLRTQKIDLVQVISYGEWGVSKVKICCFKFPRACSRLISLNATWHCEVQAHCGELSLIVF